MVHQVADRGYSASAQTYAHGRPGYPDEALEWLREVIGLGSGRTVLEIGAGTGKFLPMLVETGAEVIALEPVEAMRAKIESDFDLRVVGGAADRIDLADGSVDAVICAQAFHWFATPQALAEMRRVLRPSGVLGLIWNGRDASVPWVAAMINIIDRHQGDTPRYDSGQWRAVFPVDGLTALPERHARNLHTGSPNRVIVDRALSTSFIAALPDSERMVVTDSLRRLIDDTDELVGRAEVSVPYHTVMAAFRKDDV